MLFSPETSALLEGLTDSPESAQLRAEIVRAANVLKRGALGNSCGLEDSEFLSSFI